MSIVLQVTTATTALDIIKRALRMLGVYSLGEEPSAQESQDALAALNAMLGSISNGGMVSAKTLDAISLLASVASITVGPSGTTITDRPVTIHSETHLLIGTTTYPLTLATDQQYAEIDYKAQTGIPEAVWPLMNMPNVTLTFWPVPSQAATLQLWSDKVLASFPALTTVVSLPPGYERALAYLLAVDIAPEYEVMPSPLVVQNANNARRTIELSNFQTPMLSMPPELGGVAFNILTGDLR